MGVENEHTGVYVCMNRRCKKFNTEVEHPWNADWPLARRQRNCSRCKVRMLFWRVKKVMTEAAKAKLAALVARRKEQV